MHSSLFVASQNTKSSTHTNPPTLDDIMKSATITPHPITWQKVGKLHHHQQHTQQYINCHNHTSSYQATKGRKIVHIPYESYTAIHKVCRIQKTGPQPLRYIYFLNNNKITRQMAQYDTWTSTKVGEGGRPGTKGSPLQRWKAESQSERPHVLWTQSCLWRSASRSIDSVKTL